MRTSESGLDGDGLPLTPPGSRIGREGAGDTNRRDSWLDRVLIQQFCGGCHWHNLCLIGPECRAYYWEPIAKNTLSSRHPIRTAFNNAAPDGWQLECIALYRLKPMDTRAGIGRTTFARECFGMRRTTLSLAQVPLQTFWRRV